MRLMSQIERINQHSHVIPATGPGPLTVIIIRLVATIRYPLGISELALPSIRLWRGLIVGDKVRS